MTRREAQVRNWKIRSLRALWGLCGQLDEDLAREAREAVDSQLSRMRAEPEMARRICHNLSSAREEFSLLPETAERQIDAAVTETASVSHLYKDRIEDLRVKFLNDKFED